MGAKPAKLPPMPRLAAEYAAGASYAVLGQRYRCSNSTIRNRLKLWCETEGRPWPIVQPKTRSFQPKPHIVSAEVARNAILDACKQYRISQKTLAKHAGVGENLIHKITSSHQPRIFRATQGKILEAICQLDAGEVYLEPGDVILPMPVRDRCPKNHPYDGRTYKGRRRCTTCWIEKERRRAAAS